MVAVESVPGPSSVGVGNQVSKPHSSEMLLNLMVKLLRDKGQSAVAQLQQKVRSGEGLVVKGVNVDISVIQQALDQVGAVGGQGNGAVPGTPATAGTASLFGRQGTVAAVGAQKSASTAPSLATGARWCAPQSTASALAQKALQECETAEPFVRKVINTSENRVVILTKPNVHSQPTGAFIAAKEVFDVIARCARVQDGRTYLRLRRSEGWVSTRSCRDLWKIVLQSAEGNGSLEPIGCATTFQSRAAQVLPRVDPEGHRLDSEGNKLADESAVPSQEPRKFRAVGIRTQSIFSQPSISALTSGTLEARAEFMADAVCLMPEDGRVYLRLQDGCGWVCERSRNDFSKYAVEPADFRVHQEEHHPSLMSRKRLNDHRKAVLIDRGSLNEGEDIALPKPKAVPRRASFKEEAVILRSDAELWPEALGPPKPIKSDVRVALRRLARYYFRKSKECREDLQEVEMRADSFGRACEGKKVLQGHADALRKELTKVNHEWKLAVEKEVPEAEEACATDPAIVGDDRKVSPIQVLGETWYCAVVRKEVEEGDGNKATRQHLGPARAEFSAAVEDIAVLSQNHPEGSPSSTDEKDEPPHAATKKRRVAKCENDAD